MNRIGIITANKGRVKILEIFAAGINRLREETGLDIPCVVVGDIDGAEVCSSYRLTHIEHPNKPLTGKFNRACQELRGKVDYVMVMGTDDLISTDTFISIYSEMLKGYDMVGCDDVYFFGCDDRFTGKLVYFGHTTVLGVGRTISSRVLDAVNWTPWGRSADRGIDRIMIETVSPYVNKVSLLSGGRIFDLKTSWNINRMDAWVRRCGVEPNSDLLWQSIGEEETKLIKEYLNNQQ